MVVVGRRAGVRAVVVGAWLLALASVVCQIVYSRVDPGQRVPLTVATVLTFAAASLVDAAVRHGFGAAVRLLLVAGGGGLFAEVVGVHTGVPFGPYEYAGDLGASVFGVPLVVPLAWVMMAWPALLVGRSLAGPSRWAVVLVAGYALAAWDVFLDPQMVDAGHWVWAHPEPGLAGVPLTNFAGWLLVALLIAAGLHVGTPREDRPSDLRSGPAPLMYLWTYGSSVWAHAAFFGLPWVSLVGGLVMGAVAWPYLWSLWRTHR